MIRLDPATVLLQWATGGLLFCWVTTRRREVGLGYGWLLRGIYLVMAVGAAAAGAKGGHPSLGRDLASALTAGAATAAIVVSVVRRRAGVAGERARTERRSARVAAMTEARAGRGGAGAGPLTAGVEPGGAGAGPLTAGAGRGDTRRGHLGPEYPPALDLVAPAIGSIGLVIAAHADGGPLLLAVARTLVGAVFLGAVSDAMLLGHWYLVQPGLGRRPLNELVGWMACTWPVEVAVMLWPVGMVSVFTGRIDDGWGGTMGWFWAACALTTIVLCYVTRKALEERAYSAVMAATGLLYLAILTAFGTDLVARAVLAS